MKLKEIEAKINEVDYAIDKEVERGELKPSTTRGWLVGLAIATTVWNIKVVDSGAITQRYELFEYGMVLEIKRLGTPKTPYEQGIKESLEWCLK